MGTDCPFSSQNKSCVIRRESTDVLVAVTLDWDLAKGLFYYTVASHVFFKNMTRHDLVMFFKCSLTGRICPPSEIQMFNSNQLGNREKVWKGRWPPGSSYWTTILEETTQLYFIYSLFRFMIWIGNVGKTLHTCKKYLAGDKWCTRVNKVHQTSHTLPQHNISNYMSLGEF